MGFSHFTMGEVLVDEVEIARLEGLALNGMRKKSHAHSGNGTVRLPVGL